MLTSYTAEQLEALLESTTPYDAFFENAPCLNENRRKNTGSMFCVKLAEIDHPLMLELRRLDRLVNKLTKRKPLEKILEKMSLYTAKPRPSATIHWSMTGRVLFCAVLTF